MNVRETVEAIFAATDAEVASAIAKDKLHRGTALFVLKQFALEVEKFEPASELVAAHCEEAIRSNELQREGAHVGYGG